VLNLLRHRTKITWDPGSRAAGLAMAFKLIQAAQDRWRAVNNRPEESVFMQWRVVSERPLMQSREKLRWSRERGWAFVSS
jgi:hypothetical protein